MNRIKSLVAAGAFTLLILGLPAIASAQWNGGYGGNNNGGYYGNGNYNIRSTVRNLKNGAKNFEKAADRYGNRNDDRNNGRGWGNYGGYGNNNSSRNLENLADQFKNATNRLEDKYGNGRNLNNSSSEARRVLDIASQIDREIYNTRGNGNIQNQWNSLRQDLNTLANTYGYNNGYNNNNRNNRNNRNRNGNWRNSIPFPLPF